MALESVPKELRNLRACLLCSMVKVRNLVSKCFFIVKIVCVCLAKDDPS